MTASHSVSKTQGIRRRPSVGRRGFTLVEMLIVVGIGLLLMAIVLPAINRAYTQGERTRMALDLQAIATALEAYRQDHGDIPRPSPSGEAVTYPGRQGTNTDGAAILCRALLGPGDAATDGADGPGFRKIPLSVSQSKVIPAYLPADKFKLVNLANNLPPRESVPADLNSAAFADRSGKPILYYAGNKQANVNATNGYVTAFAWPSTTQRPMFNAQDNAKYLSTNKLRLILGDQNKNGYIDGTEKAAYTGEYLLLSAGPDEEFGPKVDTEIISSKNPADDVANFDRSSIE